LKVWARIGARQTQPGLRDTHFHSTVFGSLSSFFWNTYTPQTRPHKLIFNLHSLWAHTELAKDLEESTRSFSTLSADGALVVPLSSFVFLRCVCPLAENWPLAKNRKPCASILGKSWVKSNYFYLCVLCDVV